MKNKEILEIPSLDSYGKGYRIVFEKQAVNCPLQFEELYEKIQESPEKHLEKLKSFYQEHPLPEVANLLAYAYLRVRKKREAEALIEQTCRDHPDYLIARINYADQLLRLGKKELVPQIFNGCFDLNLLYPDREQFHFAEFRGFMTLMGFYHLEIGEREKAEEFYQFAFQVDPLHPSVAVLERKLIKISLIKKIIKTLQKLAGISKKP
jgi:tetratricopeptide (TPR) repeat protein